jgi:hypothetical protein
MPKRSSKKPTGQQEQVDTGQESGKSADTPARAESPPTDGKNPAAVALGRLGGKKGGQARARKLTAEQRREIAKKAAEARWKKKKQG